MSSCRKPSFVIKNGLPNPHICKTNTHVEEIRRHLLNREESFQIVHSGRKHINGLSLIMDAFAIHAPFVSNDFDYLKQNVTKIECSSHTSMSTQVLTYNINYMTTVQQEDMVDNRVKEIIMGNKLSLENDFHKVKFIYDFILSNVSYDNTHSRYSAYNALFDKCAVCQGCSLLFYRMASAANVPCRIILGKGLDERHSWNIVKVGWAWYNLDVTWDLYMRSSNRSLVDYKWFLKGEQTFLKHTRNVEYNSPQFRDLYKMSNVDYYKL